MGSLTFISTISLEKVNITHTRDLLLDTPSIGGISHVNHGFAILNSLYSTFLSTFTSFAKFSPPIAKSFFYFDVFYV